MLLHLLDQIRERTDIAIILASGSPRRRALLERQLQCPHLQVVPSRFEERSLKKQDFDTPSQFVMHSAMKKAEEVFDRLEHAHDGGKSLLVIGADTVVVDQGSAILEKPIDAENAKSMLRQLSGREHEVITGVSLFYRDHLDGMKKRFKSFSETTAVNMASLSDAEIDAYVATGDPLDKAGSYGIQSIGGVLVKSIQGDYNNVVGFPLHQFCEWVLMLQEHIFGQ